MKKLLLLFMTAIVTVALGSCQQDGMKLKNGKKSGNSYLEADKNGRMNRKCPDGKCSMEKKEKSGRYDAKMQKERAERRW